MMQKITIPEKDLPKILLTFPQKTVVSVLILALLCSKIYFFNYTLQHRDADFAYQHFVSKGYGEVLSSYTSASNHILYNLLCVFTAHFTSNPVLIMTVPAMATGLILLVYSFRLIYRKFGFFVATFAVVYSGSFYESSRYMIEGRGHLLMTLFSLAATVYLFKNFLQSAGKQDFYGFTLTSIAGIYTVPTFAFHLLALCIITLGYAVIYKKREAVITLLKAVLVIMAGVILCYLPALIYTGYQFLPQHEWGKYYHYFRQKYPVYLAEWTEYVTGIYLLFKKGYLYAAGTALLLGLISLKLKFTLDEKKWLIVIPVSVLVFQSVTLIIRIFPDNHLFTFFTWYLHIALALVLNRLTEKYFQNPSVQLLAQSILVLLISITGFFQYHFMLAQDLRFVGL